MLILFGLGRGGYRPVPDLLYSVALRSSLCSDSFLFTTEQFGEMAYLKFGNQLTIVLQSLAEISHHDETPYERCDEKDDRHTRCR